MALRRVKLPDACHLKVRQSGKLIEIPVVWHIKQRDSILMTKTFLEHTKLILCG